MRGPSTGHAFTRRMRWWRLDRNPLRRTVDRVEAVLLAAVCAAFALAAPWVAVVAGSRAAATSLRLERAEAGWRQVQARLLRTPAPMAPARGATAFEALTPARWTGPGGAVRTGSVYVPPAAAAQGKVLVWVNRQGRLTGAPVTAADVADRVALAALLACLATGTLLAGVAGVIRLAANRRRFAGWDVGWSVAGPQWSGRR